MSEPLRVLSLFAGIGGFDLGLERTGGFKTVAFCEIEPFAVRVLNKHWPEVPVYGDVRELTAERLRADGIVPDVICGGFPCQDLSFAGRGAGLAGERSGLWREFSRLIGEIRPAYVIVENVAALLSRGLGTVLGDMASLGYDAEWDCIPACAVGAPHRRDRIWILAYPDRCLHTGRLGAGTDLRAPARSESGNARQGQTSNGKRLRPEPRASGANVADAKRLGSQGRDFAGSGEAMGEARSQSAGSGPACERPHVADTERGRLQSGYEQRAWAATVVAPAYRRHRRGGEFGQAWRTEPNVGRVAYGLPAAVDRLRGLGNAVVPQIPELIGRAILSAIAAAAREGGDAQHTPGNAPQSGAESASPNPRRIA